jgi:four helix bundle protein
MNDHEGGDFRGLHAWQEAIRSGEIIIPILPRVRGPGAKDLIDQIARALDSIHSNIAEGYGKGFCPDNIRYQKIALSSACEAETRLEAAIRSGRLSHPDARRGIDQLRRTRALIRGLIKWIQRKLVDRPAA